MDGQGAMRCGHNLEVREALAEELDQRPLPARMKVEVNFIDEQETAGGEGVLIVIEYVRDLEEKIACPGSHVLVAIAELAVRDRPVRGCKEKFTSLTIDLQEIDARQKCVEGFTRDLEPSVPTVVQVHRPGLEGRQRRVWREERGHTARARIAEYRGPRSRRGLLRGTPRDTVSDRE